MRKLIIADDEPKIRRGLIKGFNWEEMGIEVAGEAEDGEIALKMAETLKPDIMFVDINMPFLNGLELIEKLKAVLPNCVIIIITGYDEFEYAKQAVKLGVFAYLLKPIDREELNTTVQEAMSYLDKLKERNQYLSWAKTQINHNRKEIVKTLIKDWVEGYTSGDQIKEYMELLNMNLREEVGLFVIKVLDFVKDEHSVFAIDDTALLSFSIQNIVEEILLEWQPSIVFESKPGHIVAVATIHNKQKWFELELTIKTMISKYLHREVEIFMKEAGSNVEEIPAIYQKLLKEIESRSSQKPIVVLAKNYIDRYYYKQDLTLQSLADELKLSPAHLSRIFHRDLGCTFKEYLNKVRIEKALKYMNDPTIKIYTVAERVGYSTQHYFSAAFKKMVGVSPFSYKNRKDEANDQENR